MQEFPPPFSRYFSDQKGGVHCLELGIPLLLDGKPTTILRADQNAIQFAPDIIVDADTFGQVFAGPAPTLAAVGALFGAYLQLDARHQQITLALQTIQNETHHALSLGGSSPLSCHPIALMPLLSERSLSSMGLTK